MGPVVGDRRQGGEEKGSVLLKGGCEPLQRLITETWGPVHGSELHSGQLIVQIHQQEPASPWRARRRLQLGP